VIVDLGPRRVSVLPDEPTATYQASSSLTERIAARAEGPAAQPTRAVVETLRHSGGLAPRALLGAEFRPTSEPLVLALEIGVSGPRFSPGETCVSQLWKPLVPGLSAEFAEAAMIGLLRVQELLPAGVLKIDRAGHDEVESSPLAFELAAELLVVVIAAELAQEDVPSQVRRRVEAWP
jgi:hypothetical protein